MFFKRATNQWLLETIYETHKIVGTNLAQKVINESVNVIHAGQIFIFDKPGVYDKVAFQILEDIDLPSVRPNNLVGYEPGSVISLEYGKPPRIIPTFKFRNCRFPTISEYHDYERINNL